MKEEGFLDRVVFCDESTFRISRKVHGHNVRVWGTENPHQMMLHESLPKDQCFFAMSTRNDYGPFSFREDVVTRTRYMEMLTDMACP
jgi:hypothetical protein